MQKVPCYQSRTVTVDVDQTNEFSTQPTSFELESHPSKSKSVSNTCICKLNRAPFKIPIQNHALFRFCKYIHVQAHLDYCLKNAFSCLFSGLLNHLSTQMVQHGKQVVDFSGDSSRDTLCNPGEFMVRDMTALTLATGLRMSLNLCCRDTKHETSTMQMKQVCSLNHYLIEPCLLMVSNPLVLS